MPPKTIPQQCHERGLDILSIMNHRLTLSELPRPEVFRCSRRRWQKRSGGTDIESRHNIEETSWSEIFYHFIVDPRFGVRYLLDMHVHILVHDVFPFCNGNLRVLQVLAF